MIDYHHSLFRAVSFVSRQLFISMIADLIDLDPMSRQAFRQMRKDSLF
jgi:hypothetical protein